MDTVIAQEKASNIASEELNPEDFFDIVEKQKYQTDMIFSLKLWQPEPALYPLDTASVIEKVLISPRVTETIDQVAEEKNCAHSKIVAEAKSILQEMGHKYFLGTVRTLGFFVAKLLRQLYQQVLINHSGILKLKKAMSETPLLILPTHRSYADFILITYLCYSLNIPLPVIAAGMDFKGMNLIGHMLQNCGAFFIRRSFGSDLLYWALVSEYIHYHVTKCPVPIEFFLEGTRSRNGKSLSAKTGLLTMAIEPYLKGDVPDIQICTMSISYERLLEESLYAYELLGVPKPKETTAGFMSSVAKIWHQNYGRIYVNISDPIAVSDYLSKRPTPAWGVPSHRFNLSDDEKRQLHEFGHLLINKQQRESVTPISAVLISVLSQKSTTLVDLIGYLMKFNTLMVKFGTSCLIQGDLNNAVLENLKLHEPFIKADMNGNYSCQLAADGKSDLQTQAASRLILQNYSNQLLGPLINLAVYATVRNIHRNEIDPKCFNFFAKYFKEEFVLIQPYSELDIDFCNQVDDSVFGILTNLLMPYLEIFYLILHILKFGTLNQKEIVSKYRELAGTVLTQGSSLFPEILAIDKIGRHLQNLIIHNQIFTTKNEGESLYEVKGDAALISNELAKYLDANFVSAVKSYLPTAAYVKSQL